MKFKNLFRDRTKDYSYILSVKCGDEIHRKILHPREPQEWIIFSCPCCAENIKVCSTNFYQTDYYNCQGHELEYIDTFNSFCRSK